MEVVGGGWRELGARRAYRVARAALASSANR